MGASVVSFGSGRFRHRSDDDKILTDAVPMFDASTTSTIGQFMTDAQMSVPMPATGGITDDATTLQLSPLSSTHSTGESEQQRVDT